MFRLLLLPQRLASDASRRQTLAPLANQPGAEVQDDLGGHEQHHTGHAEDHHRAPRVHVDLQALVVRQVLDHAAGAGEATSEDQKLCHAAELKASDDKDEHRDVQRSPRIQVVARMQQLLLAGKPQGHHPQGRHQGKLHKGHDHGQEQEHDLQAQQPHVEVAVVGNGGADVDEAVLFVDRPAEDEVDGDTRHLEVEGQHEAADDGEHRRNDDHRQDADPPELGGHESPQGRFGKCLLRERPRDRAAGRGAQDVGLHLVGGRRRRGGGLTLWRDGAGTLRERQGLRLHVELAGHMAEHQGNRRGAEERVECRCGGRLHLHGGIAHALPL
mmetsp:Transcript_159077/g.510169  ORF Transcript_159077/g.510169 Transcript_159077/m.510169 type:complete len:328 (-) Transcript_159077:2116-3099(-)